MEPESPPSRTTILGSLLRGRPRNPSQANPNTIADSELSPPLPQSPSPGPLSSRSRRSQGLTGAPATAAQMQPSTSQPQQSSGLTITHMLRRRRSAGNVQQQQSQNQNSNQAHNNQQNSGHAPPHAMSQATQTALSFAGVGVEPAQTAPNSTSHGQQTQGPTPPQGATAPSQSNNNANSTSHRIRLVPQLDSRRSLRFDPIGRDLRENDPPLRIGRFTDRSGLGLSAINSINSNKLAFRSKVVSRAHAEIWVEGGGKFLIRDTKSSSGTFLNHVRLSLAGSESRPFPLKDGDVLQLGVDYQGGTEDIYKSVKIRVEIGREWQAGINAFKLVFTIFSGHRLTVLSSTNALKNIRALALPTTGSITASASPTTNNAGKSKNLGIPDCCICTLHTLFLY
jgi:pSer/pThr/pTyr-binding forkhead associated (FHA) protein